jgi:hypothetical protein
MHCVSGWFQLDTSQTEPGNLAELYATEELPPALMSLLGDLQWCDQVKEWVEIADPARVVLTPYVTEARGE